MDIIIKIIYAYRKSKKKLKKPLSDRNRSVESTLLMKEETENFWNELIYYFCFFGGRTPVKKSQIFYVIFKNRLCFTDNIFILFGI